jgi:hypothetical protein
MKKTFIYSITAILVTLFAFSSVTYTSCSRKTEGDATYGCDTVTCQNMGVCSYGKCTCPAGYDGYDCSIVLAEKFVDTTWIVNEKVVKSSNILWIDTTAQYNIRTRAGYTPTSFFVDSIWGDRYKSNIICEIKSPTTFEIGTFQPINNPGGFKILGGFGKIDTVGVDKMTGTYYRYVADSAGIRTDTVHFTFTNM